MITIIDYGVGNIFAFQNVYKRLDIPTRIAKSSDDLIDAQKLILPGVGSFDYAMNRLNDSGMREKLDELVLEKKIPIIGICVGMQMMAYSSEEGKLPGLGWIDATVLKFDAHLLKSKTHLPHMGWNDVIPARMDTLFSGLDAPRYYFLHSYFMKTAREDNVLAISSYGVRFASAVRFGNVYGTQFHPEKSHWWGVRLLKNFAELA